MFWIPRAHMCNLCYVIQEPKQVELKDPLYKLHKIYSPKQKKTIGKNHCIPKIDIKTTKSIFAMHPNVCNMRFSEAIDR